MKYCVLISLLLFTGCSSIAIYTVKSYDESIYMKTSISDIIKSPNSYDGKNIELNGYFFYSHENSSISQNNKPKPGESIWVEFNYFKSLLSEDKIELFKNNKLLDYSDKRIKIKGIYSIKSNGNLGIYKGAIKEISYFGSTD